ncbi:hypothetical protein PA2G_00792 [Pseudomonas aeruginosa 2192]|nr:hypothetical protein PA2G_00792 [Pseudomonas aeruginosa 2192]
MWTYRERRNRAAFSNAQLAYDRAVDPLWDQPEPEPEDEHRTTMAWANERAVLMIEEGITAMRRSPILALGPEVRPRPN